MCAIYGFLNYGKKISHLKFERILRELSIAAEIRGTDATGISYIHNGRIVTYKKALPAHKIKLYFPANTTAVIGHNRLTTQDSKDKNYNNHPFEGKTNNHRFSLAHNGILYNDKELKMTHNLLNTAIETDSYAAVQLLEQHKSLDIEAVKSMAEKVYGSFVFTILRDDNTLFFVRGNNPITLYHFSEFGLYLYALTKEILNTALKKAEFKYQYEQIPISFEEILQISPDGEISSYDFTEEAEYFGGYYNNRMEDDIELLELWGYSYEEIMSILDSDLFEETIDEVKSVLMLEM